MYSNQTERQTGFASLSAWNTRDVAINCYACSFEFPQQDIIIVDPYLNA